MKTLFSILAGLGAAMLLLALLSCTKAPMPDAEDKSRQEETDGPQNTETQMPEQIQITIAGKTLQMDIENNAATRTLVEALGKGPISYTASDYGGFEKVGALGRSLQTSNSQVTSAPGDVVLYNGSSIVIFYGSNSWSYTRLGKIRYQSLSELKSFLKAGEGDIRVTLAL